MRVGSDSEVSHPLAAELSGLGNRNRLLAFTRKVFSTINQVQRDTKPPVGYLISR